MKVGKLGKEVQIRNNVIKRRQRHNKKEEKYIKGTENGSWKEREGRSREMNKRNIEELDSQEKKLRQKTM